MVLRGLLIVTLVLLGRRRSGIIECDDHLKGRASSAAKHAEARFKYIGGPAKRSVPARAP